MRDKVIGLPSLTRDISNYSKISGVFGPKSRKVGEIVLRLL